MIKKPSSPVPPLEGIADFDEDRVKISNILDKQERTFLPLGTQIGKYRIIEEIDRGGMAVVYKAEQLDLNRFVALKVLPANVTINRRFVERFLSEAHAVAKLNHPNIVNIHEVSMENNIYFLAMDYVPGTNLYHFMNRIKPKLVEVVEIFVQLADALSYAHGLKIVHRDLKLNNVIMRDNKVPVLIDFGLAKALEEEENGLTKTGEILGSPAYMAPERIMGKDNDARSDICSLGIMLYELLTLKNPYLDARSIHQTTLNVIEAMPVPPRKLVPWLSEQIEAVTLKAMHKEPAERYQTMDELRSDLLRFQRGEQVLASPPSVISQVVRAIRKHRMGIVLATTILAFAGLFTAIFWQQSRREKGEWRLIATQNFDEPADSTFWFSSKDADGQSGQPTTKWKIAEGVLQVEGRGRSFFRFERHFARDVRFEFDIWAVDGMLNDVGFFVCGNEPATGYSMHIHRGENAENGIMFPGTSLLFSDYDPTTFPARSAYHVVIEKVDDEITFKLNDLLVGKVYDHAMPLGKDHQKVGFFVSAGTFRIDNFRVFRQTVPELARPTIIADRFWAQGDLTAAYEEYKEVLLDITRQEIVQDVKLRLADCLIRLGELTEAEEILSQQIMASARFEQRQAHLLYLQGRLYERQGMTANADNVYLELEHRFPSHPLNQSVVTKLLLQALDNLEQDTTGKSEERIISLTKRYPRFALLCGKAHLMVLKHYASRSKTERVLTTARNIISYQEKSPDIQSQARVQMARVYLGKRKKQEAVDLLNQVIATHVPTEAVWHAWLLLGEIYEYDRNYTDAMALYTKIFTECPRTMPVCWEARIKMGEIARIVSYTEDSRSIFHSITHGSVPFVLPRMVAGYYADILTEEQFAGKYALLDAGSPQRLWYSARKALIDGNNEEATTRLEQYMDFLPSDSWEYLQAYACKLHLRKK